MVEFKKGGEFHSLSNHGSVGLLKIETTIRKSSRGTSWSVEVCPRYEEFIEFSLRLTTALIVLATINKVVTDQIDFKGSRIFNDSGRYSACNLWEIKLFNDKFAKHIDEPNDPPHSEMLKEKRLLYQYLKDIPW